MSTVNVRPPQCLEQEKIRQSRAISRTSFCKSRNAVSHPWLTDPKFTFSSGISFLGDGTRRENKFASCAPERKRKWKAKGEVGEGRKGVFRSYKDSHGMFPFCGTYSMNTFLILMYRCLHVSHPQFSLYFYLSQRERKYILEVLHPDNFEVGWEPRRDLYGRA